MSDSAGEAIAYLIAGIIILAIVVFIILYVVVPTLIALAAGGIAWGGGQSVFNYAKAFRQHVKPERVSHTP